jgi:hypothetical protein
MDPTSSPRNTIIRCTDEAMSEKPDVASSTSASASAPLRPSRSKSCQPDSDPQCGRREQSKTGENRSVVHHDHLPEGQESGEELCAVGRREEYVDPEPLPHAESERHGEYHGDERAELADGREELHFDEQHDRGTQSESDLGGDGQPRDIRGGERGLGEDHSSAPSATKTSSSRPGAGTS